MKITFRRMGTSYIAFADLFRGLGNEVISPPPITKRTLDLGNPLFAGIRLFALLRSSWGLTSRASPAGPTPSCPQGALVLVGPLYMEMHRRILWDLGYEVQTITLEPPQGHLSDLVQQLRRLIHVPLFQVWDAVRFAWKKLELLDIIEERSYYLRPRELVRDRLLGPFESVSASSAALKIRRNWPSEESG